MYSINFEAGKWWVVSLTTGLVAAGPFTVRAEAMETLRELVG